MTPFSIDRPRMLESIKVEGANLEDTARSPNTTYGYNYIAYRPLKGAVHC